MPTKCFFKHVREAVAYAKHEGGWIADCLDGTVIWYDAACWTVTPIINDVADYGGACIGTWPLFDTEHECHKFLTGKVDTVLVCV